MKASDFNLEYFKFIRDEIIKRIQIHYRLIATKFVLTGALFAFLWKEMNSTGFSAFLIPSIVTFLFDIIILENLGWIRSAGAYVKQNIENDSLPIINWEHDFAQCGGEWACFSPFGYLFGVWIIGLFLCVGHLFTSFDWCSRTNMFLLIVDIYFMIYTGFLISKNLGHKEPPMKSNEPKNHIWN